MRCLLALALPLLPVAAAAQELSPPMVVERPEQGIAPTSGGGEVVLEVRVDANGRVVDVRVVEAPSRTLGEAAARHVRGYRFEPARRGEEPIEADVRLRVEVPRLPPRHGAAAPTPVSAPIPRTPLQVAAPREPRYESVVRAAPIEPAPARSLLGDEVSRVPGTLGDPLRAVQALPGVARPGLVAGDLVVRGASPWDTAVLVDGHPIPHLYHFLQGPAVLNPAFLESVEFHPGGWGVQNGRKTGGLVEARTRAPEADRTRFEFDLDPIDSGVLYSGPSGPRSAFGIALRRSVLGEFLPLITGERAIPVYYDAQIRQDISVGGRDEVSVLFLGVQDRVVFPVPDDVTTVAGPGGESLRNETLFGRVVGTWRRRHGKLTTSVSPSLGLDRIVVQTGADDLDYRIRTARLRSDAELEVTRRLVLRAGVEAEHAHHDFAYRLPALDPFLGEFPAPSRDPWVVENSGRDDIVTVGAYFELEQRLGPLTAVFGVRGDRYELPMDRDHGTVDGRVRLRLRVFRPLALTASVGTYHQPPQPRDLSGDFGNPDLEPESALQKTVGASVALAGETTLDVEAFENRLRSQIVGSGRLVEREGEVVWENLRNGGSGLSHGVEVLLRRSLTESLSGWIAYTISEAERRNCSTCDPYVFAFDQTHILHLVLSWSFAPEWLAGARWSYVTGNPSYRVVRSTFDADTDSYDPDIEGWGDERLPAFHQLDLRIERGFRALGGRLSAYFEVLNVYNRMNPEFEVWSYDYRRRGNFSGIPIVPALGVGGAF